MQSYRQPVWRLFQIIQQGPRSLSEELMLQLLCISRALIYMDDPTQA